MSWYVAVKIAWIVVEINEPWKACFHAATCGNINYKKLLFYVLILYSKSQSSFTIAKVKDLLA